MQVFYNSRNIYYKNPFGAVKTKSEVIFRIKVIEPIKSLKCYLAMWKDNEKLPEIEMTRKIEKGELFFYTKVIMPNEGTLLWYHFVLMNFDEKYYYCSNELQNGGEGRLVEHSPISFQLTVYKNDNVPSWYKGGIAYQIFPDRFYRGKDYEMRKEITMNKIEGKNHGKVFVEDWYKNPHYERDEKGGVKNFEFYGGTLQGIEEKLEYLKELGVNVIYLNPIFEARSNHRYDTGDYMKIDSLLGDEKSFKSLIDNAKKYGIKIILDGVFNHQGADSIYFNKYGNYNSIGAYNSEDSQYFKWYNFTKFPESYSSWWGVGELPSTNEMEKSYLNFICKSKNSIIKNWMRYGIGGYRLDVADELPDEFILEIRKAMDSINKSNILIGEVWEDATNKVSYSVNRKYFMNSSLKSVTNYTFMNNAINFMKGLISPTELYEFFYKQAENYPREYFDASFNLLDSHDSIRIITMLSDSKESTKMSEEEKENYIIPKDKYMLAVSRLKVLSVFQYTVPGIPVIYYGDEVGICGYEDPHNRKTYPWNKTNDELLEHYKMIGRIRKNSNIFANGNFLPCVKGKHVFGFYRYNNKEKILVLINRGIFHNESEKIEIDVKAKYYIDLVDNKKYEIINNKLEITLSPLSYKILKITN